METMESNNVSARNFILRKSRGVDGESTGVEIAGAIARTKQHASCSGFERFLLRNPFPIGTEPISRKYRHFDRLRVTHDRDYRSESFTQVTDSLPRHRFD